MLMTIEAFRLRRENAKLRRTVAENSPFCVRRDESMFCLSARMLDIYRGGDNQNAGRAVRKHPGKAIKWLDEFGNESCNAARWLWKVLLSGNSHIWQDAPK